ncbi:MAG: ABC transporter substrate-binding protein [Chthonomonadales bacterium]
MRHPVTRFAFRVSTCAKVLLVTAGCITAFFLPVASAPASPITATDARGKRISLPSPPRRIVSLAPAITEILFALGLNGRIVADTTYCNYPPQARSLPHIGDYRTSLEKVVAQRPDLVVASLSANHQAVDGLDRLGIRVFAVDPKTVAGTMDAILQIGRITASEAQAERVIRQMRARLAAVERRLAHDRTRPKVLIVLQAQPLWVAGSANFMDDVVTLAGGVNVARDAGPGFKTYSLERVVVDQPDVILASKEDAARLLATPSLASVPAVRRHALYSIDADLIARPGPRLVEGVEIVARLLHPRAFSR